MENPRKTNGATSNSIRIFSHFYRQEGGHTHNQYYRVQRIFFEIIWDFVDNKDHFKATQVRWKFSIWFFKFTILGSIGPEMILRCSKTKNW